MACPVRLAGPPRRGEPFTNRSGPVAVGIRGGVTALQPDLVDPAAAEVRAAREESLIDAQPAARARIGVDLGQPAAHAVRVELLVPRSVQRVRQLEPLAVPA